MHCILLHKCLNFFKALHVALVFYQVCQYFCSISEPELPDNHWRSLQVKTSLQTFTLRNDNDQPVCHLVFLFVFYIEVMQLFEYFYCQVFVQRQKSAFPPNFVHSLDSTHMMMTAVACGEAGLLFAGKMICNCEPWIYRSFYLHFIFSGSNAIFLSNSRQKNLVDSSLSQLLFLTHSLFIVYMSGAVFWSSATWLLIHCLSFFKHSPVKLTRFLQVYMIRSGHMPPTWIKWIRFCVRHS